MSYFNIKELDNMLKSNPELKSYIPYIFRLRLSNLKFFTFFVFVVFLIPDLILNFLCGMPVIYFLMNVSIIHIGVYTLGIIFVLGMRSALITFLEIFGVKKGPRRHPSLSYIYFEPKKFKDISDRVIRYVFFPEDKDRWSILLGITIYLCFFLAGAFSTSKNFNELIHYLLVGEFGFKKVMPWSILGNYYIKFIWTYIAISLTSFVLIMFRSMRILNLILKDSREFTIYKIVELLNKIRLNKLNLEEEFKKEFSQSVFDKGHYTIFYFVTNSIVNFFSKISLILFLISIGYGLGNLYLALVYPLTLPRVYISLILTVIFISIGLIIFFYPQITLHKLMKGYKDNMLYSLKEIYELLIFQYINEKDEERKRNLEYDIHVASRAIEFNNNLKTWPFDINQAIKIFGGTFIALESAIIQLLIALAG